MRQFYNSEIHNTLALMLYPAFHSGPYRIIENDKMTRIGLANVSGLIRV